jgi:hypothetical protein
MAQNREAARAFIEELWEKDLADTPERVAAKEGIKTHVSSLLPSGYEVEISGDRPNPTLIELFSQVRNDDWCVDFVELPEGWEGMAAGDLHANIGERVVTRVERIEAEKMARRSRDGLNSK